MGFLNSAKKFLFGSPGKIHQVSSLRPDQEKLSKQLVNAGRREGAGGAFGDSADYYRDLLSDNPADMDAFAAPAMRQYNEEIVPGLSEQFAGMGSGGLSSSGFRNAQIQGATDLSERLGAIRANLRQAGAQGLAGIGQLGLQSLQQNFQTPGNEGFLAKAAPAIGAAAGAYAGGAMAGGAGAGSSIAGSGAGTMVGANSSPYGRVGVGAGNMKYMGG